MEATLKNLDVLFLLLGGVMILAMHAGFAFLEVGTVRHKNQVNALVKILADLSVSCVAYFFIGFMIAYGESFYEGAQELSADGGYSLTRFFFLFTFAAAIPAIISGGIAERMKFLPQLIATGIVVAVVYPLFEGLAWNNRFGFQDWMNSNFGASFHDFAGSAVVHLVGGWIALSAVLLLGPRHGRYKRDNRISSHPPSSIPFLALGSWVLIVGWFGFNVMSAQKIQAMSGLVALNSLMAMVGGTLSALVMTRSDPGFTYNGPLAGLVAVCAGSDVMHPIGALFLGAVAGVLFVKMFTFTQNRLRVDDVLGVWPLHGLCGVLGTLACGVLGQRWLGGLGNVSVAAQVSGTAVAIFIALAGGFFVYGVVKLVIGLRLDTEDEFNGADLSIHRVSATAERDTNW